MTIKTKILQCLERNEKMDYNEVFHYLYNNNKDKDLLILKHTVSASLGEMCRENVIKRKKEINDKCYKYYAINEEDMKNSFISCHHLEFKDIEIAPNFTIKDYTSELEKYDTYILRRVAKKIKRRKVSMYLLLSIYMCEASFTSRFSAENMVMRHVGKEWISIIKIDKDFHNWQLKLNEKTVINILK